MSEREAHFTALIESDRGRAVAELEALTAREPQSIEAHLLLARAHQRRLDFQGCLAAARAVLALDRNHREALHQAATSLLASGDPEAALGAYEEAFRRTRSSGSLLLASVLRHRLGRLDDAKVGLEHLVSTLPADSLDLIPTLRAYLGLLRDIGRPLEADRHAHMLLERFRREPLGTASYLFYAEQSAAFHEWMGLVDKARLAQVLKRAPAEDRGRVPETFVLPDDRAELQAFAAAEPGALFIVKPTRGSGGQGIAVTDDVQAAAQRDDVVVQRYIQRPYLIDGRKGHLRIYALITSAAPLRAYVYREGIVRFAPGAYDTADLGDVSRHVTHTALHRGHPALVIAQDPEREDEGAIWSVSAVLRRLGADGHDPAVVQDRIGDLVGWFLRHLEREGLFARQTAGGYPRGFGPKLIGFDILLDAEAQPWLIEIQTSPAAKGAPLVDRINGALFADAFRMAVGVLADDDMTPAQVAALMSDPAAIAAREIEIERANLGRFRPIWD